MFPYSSSPNLKRVPGDDAIYDNIGCIPTLALPLKWLLKKSVYPATSSFPHGSTPVEWMAGIQFPA